MEIRPLIDQAAPAEQVEVVVEEDDRALLLRQQPLVFDRPEGLITLTQEMVGESTKEPGDVVVVEGEPLRLIAIVYDVDREPMWESAWVLRAYREVMHQLDRWQAATVILPLLGVQHGHMPVAQSATHLGQVLESAPARLLQRIYLRVVDESAWETVNSVLD